MLPQEKVIQLDNFSVYEDINAFFDEFDQKNNDKRKDRNGKQNRSATRISYEKNVREFFSILLNKEIEHLTEDDLKNIKKRDVISYRKQLQDNGNSNSTVNQKTASLKSLAKFLNAEHDINVASFDLKRLDEVVESYGILNQTEGESFASAALLEREKPILKMLMIKFAIRSSFRLDEILNVKWSDFEYVDGVWKVSVAGKRGKIVKNAISEKFYNQLLELKELNKQTKWDGNQDIVFQISEGAINSMMKRLREHLNIDPSRNVVFHSFRKIAINWELEQSNGDIVKAAQQGNHSNIETTYKHYIDSTRDFSQSAGVRMDDDLNIEPELNKATLDQFKAFIKQGDYKLQKEFQKFINGLTEK